VPLTFDLTSLSRQTLNDEQCEDSAKTDEEQTET
jgi:hypothetical protein